jgi:thymidylate kinase
VISQLLDRLIERLNCREIVYCHWKSNFSLDQALSGEIDLDLLVDRESLPQTLNILTEIGYKSAVVKWGSRTPGIFHYYGFDAQMGQLVHVHLFSSILTGESFVKGHLFPFEKMLFENVYTIGKVKVTSKPAELVLFILRTFIKYGSLLDLFYLLGNSEKIRAELCWLQAENNVSEALSLLKSYCPVIDEQLFIKCIESLNGRSSLVRRVLLAWQVRQRLYVYAKYTSLNRFVAYVQFLWGQRWRLSGKKRNKVLHSGGAVIAFVGPEATGKSTLVQETACWLGKVFEVSSVHLGKPPSTWLTFLPNLAVPLLRKAAPQHRTSRVENNPSKDAAKVSLLYSLRSVLDAWDRRALVVRVRRTAANGGIVICDRYPSATVGAMDSARLRVPVDKRWQGRLLGYLARLENRIYRQIPPPDVVIRLTVPVNVAIERNKERQKKGKESDAYVLRRHTAGVVPVFPTAKTIELDSNQPRSQTINAARQIVWDVL